MNQFRQDLEQIIIGSCLLENGYARVAGVLTSKNFTASDQFDHQAIFKAIETLYPCNPIDLLTVNHKVNKPDYGWYLAGCSSRVSSAANLRYHAFILLQLSMRDVLIERLNMASSKELSLLTKSAINEIIDECLDHSTDILAIYEKAPIHLTNIGAEESLIKEITSLNNTLLRKVFKIKNQANINCIFENMLRISEVTFDSTSKLCLAHLVDVMKGVIVTGKVDDKTAKKILSISQPS